MRLLNSLAIVGIVAGAILLGKWYFKKKKIFLKKSFLEVEDPYNLEYLTREVKATIENILDLRPEALNLPEKELKKRKESRKELNKAIRNAPLGDIRAKYYLKDYISNLLLSRKFNIDEGNIQKAIPFSEPEKLNVQDKFEILLQQYKRRYGKLALRKLLEENELDQLRKDGCYGVYEEDIEQIFEKEREELEFSDRLEILCQRIYQKNWGNGVFDEIRDMEIEGVSSGVSGMLEDYLLYENNYQEEVKHSYSYDAVWIILDGKQIPLRFLSFGTEKELIRICKNIYRYNNPGQLSEERGYIENDMKDMSRVIVIRPKLLDSWAFWIRKHQDAEAKTLKELICQNGKEYPLELITYLMKGCQTTAFTGPMYAGKTTLARASIEKINPNYALRVHESIFELWLRKVFPERNIATFRELPQLNGERILEIEKRTDGNVFIMGELLKEEAARWLISVGQSGSKFTMFTHHAITTQALVRWMLNAVLNKSGLSSERLVLEQIVEVLHFDIHCEINEITGERFIERITEIIPTQDEKVYRTADIVVYDEEEKCYRYVNPLSEAAIKRIKRYLNAEEKERFQTKFGEGSA